jgi:hypothetical protein
MSLYNLRIYPWYNDNTCVKVNTGPDSHISRFVNQLS